MPIHDWTRVSAGTFHDFHLAWIAELRNALNGGLLPPTYYAQAEQIAGPLGPDVLTLQSNDYPPAAANGANGTASAPAASTGGGVATLAPTFRFTAEADMDDYALKRRTVVVRHASGDRIVALIEIVSPGNKAARHPLQVFVEKAAEALYRGFHLLVVDLFPPTPRDPQGIHAAVGGEFADTRGFALPPGEPLTLASYWAGPPKRALIEPTAVGRLLVDMPLFLDHEAHVPVPLEATYQAAYRGVPGRWRTVLES